MNVRKPLITLSTLKTQFSGAIIQPQDKDYARASTVLLRQGSPLVVFECLSQEDVRLALQYAQANHLVTSVRSGGHSNAGLSTNDGGVIIDVSQMKEVVVIDKATNRVRIGAGAHWGDVAKRLHKHRLAISAGDTVSVGASGLALGGGIGWMVRKYGLAIDSLVSVDLVTVGGQKLTANKTLNSDLFWAVRGGGGNFGVVTALEFIAHPVGDVYAGAIVYDTANLAIKLQGWRDYMRTAPEGLTTTAVLVPARAEGDIPMFIITCCWDGDSDSTAQVVLGPLRQLGTIISDDVKKKHYYEVLEEAMVPPGVHPEVNNAFFHQMSGPLVEKIVRAFEQHHMIFQIRSLGGAMNRVPQEATAFAHRDSEVMVLSPIFLPPDVNEQQIQVALEPWHDIAKESKGAYINFFSRATEREISACYPPATRKRLAAIKARYDPQNILSQNLNIKPSTNN